MTAKYFSDDYIIYLVDDTPGIIEDRRACSPHDADFWKKHVQREMDSTMSNGTW